MLNRVSLPKEIAETLEQWILERSINPGDQLRELQIAARLGTSQSPVREALRLLEERGLVTHTPNKGSIVASITQEDVRQITAVRTPLESLALRLANQRASVEDRAQLVTRLEALDCSVEDKDVTAYHSAHADLHRCIWRITRNPHLTNALERLCVPLWALYLRRTLGAQHGALSGLRAHKPLVDFVCGESSSASADCIVRQHLAGIGYEDEQHD